MGHSRENQAVWGDQDAQVGIMRAVQELLGHRPRMTARYVHVVDMPKKNPALFIPVKVG